MKKLTLIFLALLLTLCISACAESKSSVSDAHIENPNISESENNNDKAPASSNSENINQLPVENSTDNSQQEVDAAVKAEQEKQALDAAKAGKVSDAITSIGEINKDSLALINKAYSLYNELTDDQKVLVSNYSELEKAQEDYNIYIAKPVVDSISLIAQMDLNEEDVLVSCLDSIVEARSKYDALESVFQGYVDNYGELLLAEEKASEYKVNSLISFIAENLTEVTLSSEEAIKNANNMYNSLTADEKLKVENYELIAKAEATIEDIRNAPPIDITGYKIAKSSLGYSEFYLTAVNITDRIIKEFNFCVFAYDEDGVPIQDKWDDYYQMCSYSQIVKAGNATESNRYWTIRCQYGSIKNIVLVLKNVEFFDGESWENPKFNELFAKYNEKLLDLNDENII